jgi:glycosyltransferase involved in cell wall biosynthesis
MKIGIDCRIYSSKFTGIGRYVYELTSRIAQHDNENEYVLFFNKSEFEKFTPSVKRIKKVLADSPIYSLKEQLHFLHILNKEKLDLMHFTHFNRPIFYNRPSVVTIHDLTLSYYPGKKKRSILHRLAYQLTLNASVKKAKRIITISKNSKNDLKKLLNVNEDKIRVVYQGVGSEFRQIEDANKIAGDLEKYSIKKPFLLYTGVWRSHKNVPNLIKAFAEMKKNFDLPELSLVITGKEDPHYPEVKETVKALNLEKNVIFTGLVSESELVSLYNAAEIYVFPSLYEGFGLPPLEAMACGTPVAASDVSSIPEICGKGNAVFFDPQNFEDMALKIYALYSNKNLQRKLIEKGLNHVQEFSWDEMAKKTLSIYKECLNN